VIREIIESIPYVAIATVVAFAAVYGVAYLFGVFDIMIAASVVAR
jgi:hypothetical protein